MMAAESASHFNHKCGPATTGIVGDLVSENDQCSFVALEGQAGDGCPKIVGAAESI